MIRRAIVALMCIALTACAASKSSVPGGAAAYQVMPVPVAGALPAEYHIGPSDVLSVRVFQEPDLSSDQLMVDATGRIFIPLVGDIVAANKTRSELAVEITDKLRSRFLVNPQVSVNVVTAVAQRITVDGQVNKAGIFPKTGQMTLIQAIALAEGTNEIAKLNEVIVFRNMGEQRLAARFDLGAIRAGNAPDPEIMGNDVVVVGESAARRLYRDIMTTLPALAGVFVAINGY